MHYALIAICAVQCSQVDTVEQELLNVFRIVSRNFLLDQFGYASLDVRIVQMGVILCQCGIILAGL